jgi:hypothetical protein
MDTARVNTYGTLSAVPYISKRFAMKRFLGLSTEEVAENEKMWKEENIDVDTALSANAELRSAGVTPGGISSDMSELGDPQPDPNMAGMDQAGGPAPAPGGDAGTVAPSPGA